MASFNRVILMGNLTRDPEVRQTQSGLTVVKAGLAVNDRVPDGQGGWTEKASFFDITLFGKRGEAFGRFLTKGRPVLIEGRLEQDRWQDKESGQNRSKVEIIVDNWEFVGGREEGGGGGGGNYGGGRPQQQQQGGGNSPGFPERQEFSAGGSSSGGGGGFPDDVPF